MAIANLIQDVLDNWSYPEAFSLFKANTEETILVNILAKETYYNSIRLRSELVKIKDSQTPVRKPSPIVALENCIKKEDPEFIIKLKAEALMLFKSASAIHNQLEVLGSDEQRKESAFEIIRLMKQNNKIWNKINHYNQYGSLPSDEMPVIPDDPVLRKNRINNLRTYISKAKKTGETQKIEQYTKELNELTYGNV